MINKYIKVLKQKQKPCYKEEKKNNIIKTNKNIININIISFNTEITV